MKIWALFWGGGWIPSSLAPLPWMPAQWAVLENKKRDSGTAIP